MSKQLARQQSAARVKKPAFIFVNRLSPLACKVRRHWFCIAIVVAPLVAMALCCWIGSQQSVWFDEAYSVWLAKQPISELIRLTSIDTHPPLYYLILKLWASVWGYSEAALRAFSILCYGGAMIIMGCFVRRWFGKRAAGYALLTLIGTPLLMRYGFEIRMYALGSLIGVSATAVLARAWHDDRWRDWMLYAVLVAFGMGTLYYSALLWLAQLLWLMVMTYRRQGLQQWWKLPWLWAYVVSFMLFLPWLPTFLGQIGNGALAEIGQPMNLQNLLGIASFNMIYKPSWLLGVVSSQLVLIIICAVAWAWPRAMRSLPHPELAWLLLAHVGVPVAALVVVSLSAPMYVERYLAHVVISGITIASVVLYTACAALHRSPLRWHKAVSTAPLVLLPVVMVYGMVQLSLQGNFNFQRDERPNVKQIAAQLGTCRDGSVILAADPYIAIEISYYLEQAQSRCPIYMAYVGGPLMGGYAPLEGSTTYRKVADTTQPFTDAKKINVLYYSSSTATTTPTLPSAYTLRSVTGDPLVLMQFARD